MSNYFADWTPERVKAHNQRVAKGITEVAIVAEPKPEKASESRRVRQSLKPLLNKLESRWLAVIKARYPNTIIRQQARRYRLCSGAWYKPDLTAIIDGVETAWECKGPKQMKGIARGVLTLKFAAHEWPEVTFWMIWIENGKWVEQKILP